MQIDSRSDKYFITNSADVTASSITVPVPTITVPSGDGVFSLGAGGTLAPNGIMIVPFGTGSNTNTFSMSLYGWRETMGNLTGLHFLFVPVELCTFTCTLSATAGVAGSDVDNNHLFVGTITLNHGNANVSNEVVSPAAGGAIAHIIADMKGCKFGELRFGTGSSATACNALVARL